MKKEKEGLFNDKKIIPFIFLWGFFAFALFVIHYEWEINKINATMMAFSYKYGFISRGLIGTVFQGLNFILPIDMINYDGVMLFTEIITAIYFMILFIFFMCCLKKCSLDISEELKYIILFFTVWAIPMFVTEYNFGRLDIYCVMFSLLAAIILILGKVEWIVIVFSALGVMVHQGNVFMFLNIILVLLIYKALSGEGRERRKYIILFVFSFFVASILFLYFEFFSHINGNNIYEEVVTMASSLRYDGAYHQDVIDKEILGIDLSSRETEFMMSTRIQFIIFCLLMSPYIILGVILFRNIIRRAETITDKIKYLIVSIGSATIVPDLLLKCDYGRWVFAIICYYSVVLIALLGMRDKIVENEIKLLMTNINQKFPGAVILLVYPLIFQPLQDVAIFEITAELANKINNILGN